MVITNTLADRDLTGLVVSDTLPLELAYCSSSKCSTHSTAKSTENTKKRQIRRKSATSLRSL